MFTPLPLRRLVGGTAIVSFLWVVSLLAGSGCSGPSSQPAAEKPAAKPPVREAELRLLDRAGYEEFLRGQRGKVVLVDFWATWCLPCVKLLPHTVQLQERLGGRGLVVATVSLDDPELAAEVRRTLGSGGAGVLAFLARPAKTGQPETDPVAAFEIPGGSLPHFKLYGRDGRLAREFGSDTQTIDSQEIDAAVEELLSSPAP